MPAHGTVRACRRLLGRTAGKLAEIRALLETARGEKPLFADRKLTRAAELLAELERDLAGPAIPGPKAPIAAPEPEKIGPPTSQRRAA